MLVLDILAAAAAGALTGAGVGGGSLLLLYLTMARQMPQLEAQGVNLFYFLAASGPALYFHLKNRQVQWRGGLWAACAGGAACLAGCRLAEVIDPGWLKKGFGLLLLAMAARQLLGGGQKGAGHQR